MVMRFCYMVVAGDGETLSRAFQPVAPEPPRGACTRAEGRLLVRLVALFEEQLRELPLNPGPLELVQQVRFIIRLHMVNMTTNPPLPKAASPGFS